MGIEDKRIYVSDRIDELLEQDDFEFDIEYLKYIHGYLFRDVLDNCGEFRECNLTKKEYILNGDTVKYVNYYNIYDYLMYDMTEERKKNYSLMDDTKLLKGISSFTARIWQVHPFMDGNTRSVCIFIQKYLNSLGYNTDNIVFKDNNIYFRYSLVLANYYNSELGIKPNMDALMKIFEKVIFDNNIVLNFDDVFIYKTYSDVKSKVRKK